jgi:hypothetical protein
MNGNASRVDPFPDNHSDNQRKTRKNSIEKRRSLTLIEKRDFLKVIMKEITTSLLWGNTKIISNNSKCFSTVNCQSEKQ